MYGVIPRRGALLLSWVILVSFCFAQSRSAKLIGVVTDSPAELAGAEVRLLEADSQRLIAATITDTDGSFSFIGLPWGVYTLDVLSVRGQRGHVKHIELRSESTMQLSIVLHSLADARPSSSRLLAEDLWWGTQFTELSTEKLPNARNIWSLLESQEPSTVTNRLDIAGLETGVPAL